MARTLERAEREIIVLRDTLFRCMSTLAAQIPFAPSDPDAEEPFECLSAVIDVLNEVRDEQPRDEGGWVASAMIRLAKLKEESDG